MSARDGAWICTVKRDLTPEGLPARFSHAAQAELSNAIAFRPEGPAVRLRGDWVTLPDLD